MNQELLDVEKRAALVERLEQDLTNLAEVIASDDYDPELTALSIMHLVSTLSQTVDGEGYFNRPYIDAITNHLDRQGLEEMDSLIGTGSLVLTLEEFERSKTGKERLSDVTLPYTGGNVRLHIDKTWDDMNKVEGRRFLLSNNSRRGLQEVVSVFNEASKKLPLF